MKFLQSIRDRNNDRDVDDNISDSLTSRRKNLSARGELAVFIVIATGRPILQLYKRLHYHYNARINRTRTYAEKKKCVIVI